MCGLFKYHLMCVTTGRYIIKKDQNRLYWAENRDEGTQFEREEANSVREHVREKRGIELKLRKIW